MHIIQNIKKIAVAAMMTIPLLSTNVMAEDTETKTYTYTTGTESTTSSSAKSNTWTQVSDDTWTMVVKDKSGSSLGTVTLKTSINENGEQQFDYTFNVLDASNAYYVYEEMAGASSGMPLKSGYESKGSDSTEEKTVWAIPQDPGETTAEKKDSETPKDPYTITNSNGTTPTAPEYGNLSISKKVTVPEGSENKNPDQKFGFKITLSAQTDALRTKLSVIKSVKYTTTKEEGEKSAVFTYSSESKTGSMQVYLSADETVTFTDIPAGITYSVQEDLSKNNAGDFFEIDTDNCTGLTGAIVKDSTSSCIVTNKSTYVPPKKEYTSFKLTKKVIDNGGVDNSFTFNVTFGNLEPYEEIKITGITNGTNVLTKESLADTAVKTGEETVAAKKLAANKDGSAVAQIKLSKDQTAVFYNVLIGSEYSVTEEGTEYTPSYTVTNNASEGSVSNPEGNAEAGDSLSTSVEEAEEGEDIDIVFINTITRTQKLTIKKKDLNAAGMDAGSDTVYDITVHFSGLSEGYKLTYTNGAYKGDFKAEESGDDFVIERDMEIKAGEDIVFDNVPVGATYYITEKKNSKIGSYIITAVDADGNTVTDSETGEEKIYSEGSNGQENLAISTEKLTVAANENPVVTFTNKPKIMLPVTGGTGREWIYSMAGILGLVLIASTLTKMYKTRED